MYLDETHSQYRMFVIGKSGKELEYSRT